MSDMQSATDVLIIGAGPTGLALAATLAQAKVGFALLDKLPAPQDTSRAAGIHARTLEVLEGVGVTDRLVAVGRKVQAASIRDRNTELLHVTLEELPTRYPYILVVPQQQTEAILTQRLAELGGAPHRGQELVGLRQDGGGVTGTVRGADGAERTVRARFAVAADGYHSAVRAQAGIAFQAGTYPQGFVLGDVALDWPDAPADALIYFAPAGILAILPFATGHHRVIATLDDAPEHPSAADLQAVLDERGPRSGGPKVRDVTWASRFRIHHGVAARFREGRVFLAGDAAHVHSPAGGQGMNIGIQDACELGRRLAAALQGPEGEAGLDGYEAARRPVAERVVKQTDRLTRVATMTGTWKQELRNLGLEAMGHIPALRRQFALQLSELKD